MPSKKSSSSKPDDQDEPQGLLIQVSPDWRAIWDGVQFLVQRKTIHAKGNNIGKHTWKTEAYCREIGAAVHYLASRRIYGIADTYGIEAIEPLCRTLDEIKADAAKMVREAVAGLPAADIWEPLP